ncbi:MAG: hypothetical protein KGJ06_08270 [Pseudomonadota bacterium]|nr:hypothetical protein [Pseudomonadota bacterium]
MKQKFDHFIQEGIEGGQRIVNAVHGGLNSESLIQMMKEVILESPASNPTQERAYQFGIMEGLRIALREIEHQKNPETRTLQEERQGVTTANLHAIRASISSQDRFLEK